MLKGSRLMIAIFISSCLSSRQIRIWVYQKINFLEVTDCDYIGSIFLNQVFYGSFFVWTHHSLPGKTESIIHDQRDSYRLWDVLWWMWTFWEGLTGVWWIRQERILDGIYNIDVCPVHECCGNKKTITTLQPLSWNALWKIFQVPRSWCIWRRGSKDAWEAEREYNEEKERVWGNLTAHTLSFFVEPIFVNYITFLHHSVLAWNRDFAIGSQRRWRGR